MSYTLNFDVNKQFDIELIIKQARFSSKTVKNLEKRINKNFIQNISKRFILPAISESEMLEIYSGLCTVPINRNLLPPNLEELKWEYERTKDQTLLVKLIFLLKKYKSSIQQALKILNTKLESKLCRYFSDIDEREIIFRNSNSSNVVHVSVSDEDFNNVNARRKLILLMQKFIQNETTRIYVHSGENHFQPAGIFN